MPMPTGFLKRNVQIYLVILHPVLLTFPKKDTNYSLIQESVHASRQMPIVQR